MYKRTGWKPVLLLLLLFFFPPFIRRVEKRGKNYQFVFKLLVKILTYGLFFIASFVVIALSLCFIFTISSLLLFLIDLDIDHYSSSNYCYLSQGFLLFLALRGNSDKICIYFSLSPLRKRQGISIKQKINIVIAIPGNKHYVRIWCQIYMYPYYNRQM